MRGTWILRHLPLSSSRTNTIRIFNRAGGEIGGIRVAREMKPPFDLCVGDFSPSRPGDELAVISGKVETPSPMVLLYSPSGEILRRISFPGEPGRFSLLTQGLNRLLVQEPDRKRLHQLLPEAKTFPWIWEPQTANSLIPFTRIVISTAVNPSRSNPPWDSLIQARESNPKI